MKNRLCDNLIAWSAPIIMLIMVGFSIWIVLLGIQGIDWLAGNLSELKEAYFTPLVPELAVTTCALLCLGYFLVLLWLSAKAKERHPASGILCAYGDTMIVVVCWTIYISSSQHMDLSLIIRWFAWLMIIGLIATRLEKDCKIAYTAFWAVFLLSLNEYFGRFPLLSMTGVRPEDKDFLEHHFGLTQLIMLTHAAILLATPSAFKWIWFDADRAREEQMKKIFGELRNQEETELANLPRAAGDKPSDQ